MNMRALSCEDDGAVGPASLLKSIIQNHGIALLGPKIPPKNLENPFKTAPQNVRQTMLQNAKQDAFSPPLRGACGYNTFMPHLSDARHPAASSPDAKFIVFEGIDGCGKTTQCKLLADALEREGIACEQTREPSEHSIVGPLIRSMLQEKNRQPNRQKSPQKNQAENKAEHQAEDPEKICMRSAALAYLFAADRYEHVYSDGGIVCHLAGGRSLLCDRYFYSSLAYQGTPRLQRLVMELNAHFPAPDLIFYFDIDETEALRRIGSRGSHDAMEQRDILSGVKLRYERMFFDAQSPLHAPLVRADGSAIPVEKIHAAAPEAIIARVVKTRALALFR